MKDRKKAEEIATQRLQILSPMLVEGIDSAKVRQIREQVCTETGLSERTLRRYLSNYHQEGFSGLIPKGKGRNTTESIAPHILEQAILLRREVPTRSVAQIIQILEWEGQVELEQLKRSTLQEKLAARGYSTRHMKLYASSGVAARRYQKKYRNKIWHSDIKFGPFLPIGPDGTKKRVYLVIFQDDCTRFILHGEFYPTLDKIIVEDSFRKAILKFGVPDATYFDYAEEKTMPKVF